MKVLHIACGVSYSKVYSKLFSEFKSQDFNFEVYVPQHQDKNVKELKYEDFPFQFYSNRVIKPYDKVLYYTKIHRMLKDVEKNFDLSKVSLVHSHSLFSDGAVAYEIFKKYEIPYIIAVRNTDVNKYFKYAFHLRKYALEIMRNAKKIIFISHSYHKYVIDKYVPRRFKEEILSKTEVIPNGVDSFWLKESTLEKNKKIDRELIKLIFVGRIDYNKNLKSVINTYYKLKSKGFNCLLNVVGDGPLRQSIERKCHSDDNIIFHGAIQDKKRVRELYMDSDILIVPSYTETFGLVYVEAMSCGLPIIYTENQGFDGFFNNGAVGYAINPYNVEDIAAAVDLIIRNYENISSYCLCVVKRFDWLKIANKYVQIYLSNGKLDNC